MSCAPSPDLRSPRGDLPFRRSNSTTDLQSLSVEEDAVQIQRSRRFVLVAKTHEAELRENAAGENGVSGPNIQVGCVNGAIQECHHVLRVASFREVAHISACQRMGMQQQILSIRVTRLDEVEIGNRTILFLYTFIASRLHSPEIVLSTSLITSNSVFFVLRFVELRCLLLALERERCLCEWERRRWLLARE